VTRSAAQHPERIHDLIGNIAECVTAQGGYYAIGGSSISPARPEKVVRMDSRRSDVGFRLVVELQPADDPLPGFLNTIKQIQ
jgi:hypothetical protein